MKGKQRSLNGLFWRYLLSTMALLAGVLLALWFVLLQLIRMGAVLPAEEPHPDGRGSSMDPDGHPNVEGMLIPGGPPSLLQLLKQLVRKDTVLLLIQTTAGHHIVL